MAQDNNGSWGPIADLSKKFSPKKSAPLSFGQPEVPSMRQSTRSSFHPSVTQYDLVATLDRLRFIIAQKEIQFVLMVIALMCVGGTIFVVARSATHIVEKNPIYRPAFDVSALPQSS